LYEQLKTLIYLLAEFIFQLYTDVKVYDKSTRILNLIFKSSVINSQWLISPKERTANYLS